MNTTTIAAALLKPKYNPSIDDLRPVQARLHHKRRQLTLRMIDIMVSKGFVFFSSVLTDSTQHKYHVPVAFAMVDSMFFYMPGKACIVGLSLDQQHGIGLDSAEDSWNIEAKVYAQQKDLGPLDDVLEFADFCQKHGFVGSYRNDWGYDETDYCPPLFTPMGDADYANTWLPSWYKYGGLIGSQTHASSLGFGPKTNDSPEHVAELADGLLMLAPIIEDGKIAEMSGLLYPYYVFPTSKDTFWESFNSRVFRTLVRKVT